MIETHKEGKFSWEAEIETLRQQLAASQAREMRLREALEDQAHWLRVNQYTDFEIQEALALPQDTTVLEAMIAEAGEVMRERCSGSAQAEMDEQYIDSPPWYAVEACRDAISTLPCVTLEDLQK